MMDGYKNLVEMIPKLRVGIKFTQFVLFFVNFLFGIVGTIFIVMSFAIYWANSKYELFLEVDSFKPVPIFIAVAVIMFLIALFGGIAVTFRSTLIVNVYTLLLLIVLILEINAGITIYIMHQDILYKSIEENMVNSLNNHTEWNWEYVMGKWNYLQDQLNCCGIHGPTDWAPLNIDGPEVNTDGYSYTVPYSCCGHFYSDLQTYLHCYDIASAQGCFTIVEGYISKGLLVLVYITVITTIAQLFGMLFSLLLSRAIRRVKTEEEMKRQELQHLIYNDLHKQEEDKQVLTTSSSDN